MTSVAKILQRPRALSIPSAQAPSRGGASLPLGLALQGRRSLLRVDGLLDAGARCAAAAAAAAQHLLQLLEVDGAAAARVPRVEEAVDILRGQGKG